MPLVSELRRAGSPVNVCIHRLVFDLRNHTKAPAPYPSIIYPDLSDLGPGEKYNATIVGRAIDFRIRLYFAEDPGIDNFAELPALLDAHRGLYYEWESIMTQLRPWEATAAFNRDDESLINRLCITLGHFDELARDPVNAPTYSRLLNPVPLEFNQVLDLATETQIEDMCNLSWAFHSSQGELLRQRSTSVAVAAPTFDGSQHVGGADGDILIGDCLIDVKSVKYAPNAVRDGICQLVGYALLDYSDRYKIRSVAVYLARQATLRKWSLYDLLDITTDDELQQRRNLFRNVVAGEMAIDACFEHAAALAKPAMSVTRSEVKQILTSGRNKRQPNVEDVQRVHRVLTDIITKSADSINIDDLSPVERDAILGRKGLLVLTDARWIVVVNAFAKLLALAKV